MLFDDIDQLRIWAGALDLAMKPLFPAIEPEFIGPEGAKSTNNAEDPTNISGNKPTTTLQC